MLHQVVFSEEAALQLEDLEEYLAERFYPKSAERYVQRLFQACLSLGEMPFRGTKREDLGSGVRVAGFERRASIYFQLIDDRVVILAVSYGGFTYRPLS